MSDSHGENITQLSQQVEDLIRQLNRAEQALAERLGVQVDAVIDPETSMPILLRQAQHNLQESETRYRRLTANMAAAIFELDPDGRILFVSSAVTAITGYRPEELFGGSWWDIFFPGGQRGQAEKFLSAVRRSDVSGYELVLTSKGGDLLTLEVNTANYYGPDQTLEDILGFGVDITRRRQAERELDRYRSQLEKLVEIRTAHLTRANVALQVEIAERKRAQERAKKLQAMTAALSRALTPGDIAEIIINQGGAELQAAAGALSFLDHDLKEFKTIHALAMPENVIAAWHRHPAHLAPLFDEGKPIWFETSADRAARFPETAGFVPPFAGSWAVLPILLNGDFLGTLIFAFAHQQPIHEPDRAFMVTLLQLCIQGLERARLYEAEALARQEAEKANALKTQFLGMVSHELRTPLTSIKGFVSTLLATDVSWDASIQQESLQIMEDETDKLSELVDQLLDVSRLQAGQLTISARPQPVAEVLSLASSQVQSLAARHHLVVDIPDTFPPIMADGRRVAQVIVNLVGNAAKYSPDGTWITLRARAVDGFIQFDVIDEGEGVPDEKRQTIFEAFRQGDRPSGPQTGAGLGLTICKGLVEAHGGKIWIQNNEGGSGAAFSFTVPLAPPDLAGQ